MPQLPRCPGCPYGGKAIASRGRVDSRLVLVGEAPGAREIECEEPFRGAAGRVLSGAIEAAGLHEEELLIVNAIACRPQPVRPTVAAIDSCRGRLMGELHEHPRAVVVTLGATPLRAVAEDKTPVLRAREDRPSGSVLG
jgi:uracil-DNA glycosylase family 4